MGARGDKTHHLIGLLLGTEDDWRRAWWSYHPREWRKKAALVNDTSLINNPFTFQSMEKHSAYCAMIRLGFDIPETWLVPYKNPVDHEKWAYTAERYNLP